MQLNVRWKIVYLCARSRNCIYGLSAGSPFSPLCASIWKLLEDSYVMTVVSNTFDKLEVDTKQRVTKK